MRKTIFFIFLFLLLLLPCMRGASQEDNLASSVKHPEEMVRSLRLRDAPLDMVLDQLASWTGRIILRPQALPAAQITLNITSPISKAEAVRAVESVLALNNIAVVPMGDKYLKVVELTNKARMEGPELIEGSTLGMAPTGKSATKIFTLTYLKASDIIQQLNTLLNVQVGGAVLFANTNSFMVTESISNLQKIERILAEIDRPTEVNMRPLFYVLQNAKASELLPRLQTLLQGPAQVQVGNLFTLSADDRTNQIIVFADERRHELFREIIAHLDAKSDPYTRNEVIYLNNATAEDVVKRLTELISGQAQAAAKVGNAKKTTTTTTTVAAQQRQTAQQQGRRTNTRQTAQPVKTTTVTTPVGATITSDFSPLLSVVADERANAVIVTGTPTDIIIIKDIIGKLDIPLMQVRIEVVVAEVRVGDSSSSGIESLGLQVEAGRLTGFTLAGPGFSATGDGNSSFVQRSSNWDLTGILGLSTTPRKSFTSIISTPSIVTSHNKEAFIFVGEQRPVISSYLNEGTSTGLYGGYRSTVSMLDIGLRLTVTPLIGKDGSVQMTVEQKVEDVVGEVTIDGNSQPIIGRRETESFITVNNGEIIVLGGLQRQDATKSTTRLGPIPIIGDLFGSRSREDNRTDLIFFLRPIIITGNPEEDNRKANEAVEKMYYRSQIKRVLNEGTLFGDEAPEKEEKSGPRPRLRRQR